MSDPSPAEPVVASPDRSLAAEPVDASHEEVEIDTQGEDAPEDDYGPIDGENGGGK